MNITYLFDQPLGKFALAIMMIDHDRRDNQTVHEYNMKVWERYRLKLPVQRRVDAIFLETPDKEPSARLGGDRDSKMWSKKNIQDQLNGNRGKYEGRKW